MSTEISRIGHDHDLGSSPLVAPQHLAYSTLMSKDEPPEPKRRNKTLSVADVLAGALDPVL